MTIDEVKRDFCVFYQSCFEDAQEIMRQEGYSITHQTRALLDSLDPTDASILQVISFEKGGSLIELVVRCNYTGEDPERRAWFVYSTADAEATSSAEKAHMLLQSTVHTYRPMDQSADGPVLH